MQDEPLPPGYPVEWEADVVLRDGTVAHVRPICPSDGDGIRRFHAAQSDESIYLRFFAPLRQLSDNDVFRFTHVDYADRVALVATMREEIIGIGRYDRIDGRSAEVAFNISDHFQGKGIGSVLLEHLAAIAQEFGIARFTAEVLPQNRKMLSVFSDAGYDVKRHIEDGVVEVGFDIEPTDSSKAVAMSREHRAEALSVRSILHPSTIAVIGASRRRDSIGSQLLDRLVQAGFTGTIHPVNPNVRTLRRRTAYPSVVAVPGQVDLAVIAVPSHAVLEVVDECAEAGVKSLLVVSSGFAEEGRDGARLQAELLRRSRNAGMRVVGPNSFGLINNDPAVRLNASLAPTLPPHGQVGLFAQSGALGIAVLASAARRNLGVSDVRVGRQPGRRVRQRLHAVLDRRRVHERRRAVPRVHGQPAQVLAHRAQPGPDQAGHRREVRGLRLRRAAGPPGAQDQGPPRGVPGHAQAGRGHPGRERPPALRHRPARRAPAAARGRPRGHRRQLRRRWEP